MNGALAPPTDLVARAAPEAAADFEQLEALALEVADPVLVELVRLRMVHLLGDERGSNRRSDAARACGLTEPKISELPRWPTSDEFSAVERACLGLAEQYVIDVSAVSDADTEPVFEFLGARGLYGFVQALWVVDESIRLDLALGAALGGTFGDALAPGANPEAGRREAQSSSRDRRIPFADDGSHPALYQPEMTQAQGRFYSAVGRLDGLDDPVLLEVVRIRCARTHDCRMCKASRYRKAHEAGLDEASLSAVDWFEASALPERLKVALRYTDVFLSRPADMSPDLRRDLGAHFTDTEIVFLSLEIAKFSIQKQLITLGIDVLPGLDMDREVAWFKYDASGQIEYLGSPELLATAPSRGLAT